MTRKNILDEYHYEKLKKRKQRENDTILSYKNIKKI